mgnify:CR=1 FL=1
MNTNQIDKFYYGVCVSAPCLCPVECLYTRFLWEDGYAPVSGVSIAAEGVGRGFNGIISNEKHEKKLPKGISTVWMNYNEKKVYELEEFLPFNQILDLFKRGVSLDKERNSKGIYKFDTLDLCYLPDGEVMLYVKSYCIKILLDWSAKGEVSSDYDKYIVSSREEETMNEYFDASIKQTNERLSKNCVKSYKQSTTIIKQLFKRYNYRISFEFEDADTKVGLTRLFFTNGETYNADFNRVFEIIQTPSIVENVEASWDTKDSRYAFYMYFNEDEMFTIFEEAYGLDNFQKGELKIKVCKYNNLFEVSLNVCGKIIPLKKTEIRVYVKPLAQLDQDWKLVFKNYKERHNYFSDDPYFMIE